MTDPVTVLTAALADRYRIERELGAGGMATVYDMKNPELVSGRLNGMMGFGLLALISATLL